MTERIGHRGSPRERTENTLPGFLLAIEHGADAVELDVHVTRDGVVVVHHDFDVQGLSIARTPWATLSGVRFQDGSGIPTLAEVLQALAGKALVYVELKGREIERAVAEVPGMTPDVVALHSFDHAAIARCARAFPHLPRGILIDRGVPNAVEMMTGAMEAARPRDVWPHHTLVNARFMDVAARLGLRVIPWTVNSRDEATRLKALGVAGICTDDVRLADI